MGFQNLRLLPHGSTDEHLGGFGEWENLEGGTGVRDGLGVGDFLLGHLVVLSPVTCEFRQPISFRHIAQMMPRPLDGGGGNDEGEIGGEVTTMDTASAPCGHITVRYTSRREEPGTWNGMASPERIFTVMTSVTPSVVENE